MKDLKNIKIKTYTSYKPTKYTRDIKNKDLYKKKWWTLVDFGRKRKIHYFITKVKTVKKLLQLPPKSTKKTCFFRCFHQKKCLYASETQFVGL